MTQPSEEASTDDVPEAERACREAALDRTIENSFPASDPLSTIPNPNESEPARLQEPESSDLGVVH